MDKQTLEFYCKECREIAIVLEIKKDQFTRFDNKEQLAMWIEKKFGTITCRNCRQQTGFWVSREEIEKAEKRQEEEEKWARKQARKKVAKRARQSKLD